MALSTDNYSIKLPLGNAYGIRVGVAFEGTRIEHFTTSLPKSFERLCWRS